MLLIPCDISFTLNQSLVRKKLSPDGGVQTGEAALGNCCFCLSATQKAIFIFHHVVHLNCPARETHSSIVPSIVGTELSIRLR